MADFVIKNGIVIHTYDQKKQTINDLLLWWMEGEEAGTLFVKNFSQQSQIS